MGGRKATPPQGDPMKHITILALDGTIASTVTGPADIFSLAGVLWNRIRGVQPEPYFKVVIASVQGKPVGCVNGIVIQPHLSLEEVKRTDLIIISAEDLAVLDATSRRTVPWLLKHHKAGSTLASVCTGLSCWRRPASWTAKGQPRTGDSRRFSGNDTRGWT